jgi:Zn-dependent protease with chaperone function
MTLRPPTRIGLATVLLTAVVGCTAAPKADLQPGAVPAPDSVEAGLWMVMERAETRLKTSGRVVPDPALQGYVHDIVCRLAADHCNDLRTYVLRQPGFNASMAPNGFMSVWTGLLLRCEDEDQLASVIGHEVAHYVRRHSLQRWEAMRDSLAAAQVFGVVTAGLGVPLGGFAVLGAYGHVQSYSRDQEREADSLGFTFMTTAAYDPHQAPKIWENLIAEMEAAEDEAPDPFFASHPPSEERMATLREMATASDGPVIKSNGRFHELVIPHRAAWLEDEVDLGRYAEIQVLLDRLKRSGQTPGVVWYYQGEILRRDVEVEDKGEAIAAYRKALDFDDVPAAAYRGLGLLLAKQGDSEGARSAYQSYLAKSPDADDHAIIRYYLKELEKTS